MVDLERLKKAIQKKGLSYSDIAKALGITRSCVSHKMSGVIDFKVSQVYSLAELLDFQTKNGRKYSLWMKKRKIKLQRRLKKE